ncbi:MAG: 3-dehydroquinate synthase, partial [Bacteroidota bacterium]
YGHHPQPPERFDALIELMRKDKKNEGGSINFTLLSSPGTACINQVAEVGLIVESLRYYNGD